MGSEAPSTYPLVSLRPVVAPDAIRLTAGNGGVLVGEMEEGAIRIWLGKESGQRVLIMRPRGYRAAGTRWRSW
jgi:hypothetical protein